MSELDNKITNDMSREIGSTTSKTVNTAKNTLNVGRRIGGSITNSIKNATKSIKKATSEATKKAVSTSAKTMLSAIPLPILLAIGFFIVFVFILLCVYANQSDSVTSYENAQTRRRHQEYQETHPNPSPTIEDEEIRVIVENSDAVSESSQIDFYGDNERVAEAETEYDGESSIGNICVDYINYYNEVFDFVYDYLCKYEVMKGIITRNLNKDATLESYFEQENPFKESINFAEILTVQSMNDDLALDYVTIDTLHEYLNREELPDNIFDLLEDNFDSTIDENSINQKLMDLFSVVIEECLGQKELFSYTKTEKEKVDSPAFNHREGEVISEKRWERVKQNTSTFRKYLLLHGIGDEISADEFEAYCESNFTSDECTYEGNFIFNGRSLIKTSDTPPCISKVVTIDKQYIENYDVENSVPIVLTPFAYSTGTYAQYYDYDRENGYLIDKVTGQVVTETETKTEYTLVTEYKIAYVNNFIYGKIHLVPYCLNDLFECFSVDKNGFHTQLRNTLNKNVLNEQEKGLRDRVTDVDFGNEERTDMYTDYSRYLIGATSEIVYKELMNNSMAYYELTGNINEDLYNICKKIEGQHLTYGGSYNGYSPYVCCTFVYDVFKQLGIPLCPNTFNEIDSSYAQQLGAGNTTIWQHCTLMAHYFKRYQSQAVVSSSSIQAGDIVFTQLAWDLTDNLHTYNQSLIRPVNKSQGDLGDYSDHVFIYLGDNKMAEMCGNGCHIWGVSQEYLNNIYCVVRPTNLH